MVEVFTLTCPSCNGKLEITRDVNRFACAHCGNEHIVIRSGGTISIKPVIEEIKGMRDDVVSVKRRIEVNNAELAVSRINPELSALRSELKALKEKSKNEITLPGMIGCFGFLFIISGIIAIFIGAIGITALFFIIGIILIVIFANWPSRTEKKIEQLKERIERLEKKKKANLQIINRGI